jgi:molybdopterin molybdotransferase
MLHPDAALALIEALEFSPRSEEVALQAAPGRVLAGEVLSPLESPPFDKAAMDGYALAAGDASDSFRVIETVAAGQVPARVLRAGECARIMTGAMLPEGADRVVRVEYSEERQGRMRLTRPEPDRNVIERGENLKVGEKVLDRRRLRVQDIGVLASLGFESVRVARAPVVGIMATGSELREPGRRLGRGQIYNSNGAQLCAQAGELGCPTRYYGIQADDPAVLGRALEEALGGCDLLLLSGGVSMGEFDFVPRLLDELGAEIVFHRLAIKPGKPTLFARRRDSFVFGMPGNPVSAFVIFELLVKPFVYRWMGLHYRPLTVTSRLARSLRRGRTERVEYRPVRLAEGGIFPVRYQGSSHLNALAEANALVRFEQGVDCLEQGEEQYVRCL